MIPRRWIKRQLTDEHHRGYVAGLANARDFYTKQRKGKWTKGHIVIGFVKGEKADEMFRAHDEVLAFIHASKGVRCKIVGMDIATKELFVELATSGTLEGLLAEIEAACPSLAAGSASAGRFVRTFA